MGIVINKTISLLSNEKQKKIAKGLVVEMTSPYAQSVWRFK